MVAPEPEDSLEAVLTECWQIYALLVNRRWFKKQAMLELWEADLHNIRAVACEVIAKQLYAPSLSPSLKHKQLTATESRPKKTKNSSCRKSS